MKVGIVCRQNLVRSRFLELYLSTLYPTIEFWSAGTAVTEDSNYNFENEVCEKFGIVNSQRKQVDLNARRNDLENSDLVLVAEKSLWHSYRNIPGQDRVIFLDEVGKKMGLSLIDPLGCSSQELEIQLYGHAFVACTILNRIRREANPVHKLVGLIPENMEAFPIINQIVSEKLSEKSSLVIQSCIGKTPYLKLNELQSQPIPNSLLNSFSGFISNHKNESVFHFEYEVPHPIKVLTSRNWRENIELLLEEFDIYLVSAPLHTSLGIIDWNAYFGVMPTVDFQVVASKDADFL